MERKSPTGTLPGIPGVSPGARRYIAPYWRAIPARIPPAHPADLAAAQPDLADPVMQAILELSREDEELGPCEDRGPILFKDGIFQIDMEHPHGADGIDPNLKGLIDSIMNPT